jgi:anthranilate synthase
MPATDQASPADGTPSGDLAGQGETHPDVDYPPGFGGVPPLGICEYATAGGIKVTRSVTPFEPSRLAAVTREVDLRRGGIFSSGMEYPGRYSRWHMGYMDPCIELVARGRQLTATALNERGAVLLPAVRDALATVGDPAAGRLAVGDRWPSATVVVAEPQGTVPEEERSRRPTVFSAIRAVIALFAGPDEHLGLFGAFGYDLAFQFEPVRLRHARQDEHGSTQRDLVLHLPDELYVIDRKRETALRYSYDFAVGGRSTAGLDRATGPASAPADQPADPPADPEPGSYAGVVGLARERFAAGDLYEVVPSHVFWARCGSPAAFYEALRRRNPAPYEFFINLGDDEFLVGASPEMYVRVTGDRVETCPIAGTAPRGNGPLQDADHILGLLSSAKDESELTMCTDVDRNDKSRICVPGSVRVIGRRQIEMYSRVIHTVDHVEGRLRPGFDALDAFLTHMWAVTVTGAPKTWAMQFIEDHETSPRRWYGGAVGVLHFDGSINTGLTLRTAHIRSGLAAVRTGATLLFDSDPAAEEAETRMKAGALLEVLAEASARSASASGHGPAGPPATDEQGGPGESSVRQAPRGSRTSPSPSHAPRVLLVDHQDSFVLTLASYFREQGAEVTTLRAGFDPVLLDRFAPDLVVLSPGPGRPADFKCSQLLSELDERGLAAFGVCLGLQAMVEHAGGSLSVLSEPAHGKPAPIMVTGGELLAGLGAEFTAGRYHSLHARADQVRGGFEVTATTRDGIVMAIENPAARRWAVQFHPESILSASGGAGHTVIGNVLRLTV